MFRFSKISFYNGTVAVGISLSLAINNEGVEIMKKAFTLIELLVVIAIIAILAAILFPVFAQAKEAAKKTADLSNQKQINLGQIMYSADSDDVYARGLYFVTNNAGNWVSDYTWRNAVNPYVKNSDGRRDMTSGAELIGGGLWSPPGFNNVRSGYHSHDGLNPIPVVDWGPRRETAIGRPSMSQTAIPNVARTLLITTVGVNPNWDGGVSGSNMDSSWWWWGGETQKYNAATRTCGNAGWPPVVTGPTAGFLCYNKDNNDWPNWSMPRFRYSGGANVGFADGHAKFNRAEAFNWCTMMYLPSVHTGDAWTFDPGNFCAPFAGLL